MPRCRCRRRRRRARPRGCRAREMPRARDAARGADRREGRAPAADPRKPRLLMLESCCRLPCRTLPACFFFAERSMLRSKHRRMLPSPASEAICRSVPPLHHRLPARDFGVDELLSWSKTSDRRSGRRAAAAPALPALETAAMISRLILSVMSLGRLAGPEMREPGGGHHVVAELLEGRDVGEVGQPRLAGMRDRAKRAAAHQRGGGGHGLRREDDMAAGEIGQALRRALVGHVLELDAGQLGEISAERVARSCRRRTTNRSAASSWSRPCSMNSLSVFTPLLALTDSMIGRAGDIAMLVRSRFGS